MKIFLPQIFLRFIYFIWHLDLQESKVAHKYGYLLVFFIGKAYEKPQPYFRGSEQKQDSNITPSWHRGHSSMVLLQ